MDWSNERYVRVYTRDTTTWKLMDWRGRVVLSLLFRKVDRAGVLDVGHDGVLGLAAVLELPLDIVEAGIAQLTNVRGGQPTVVDTGTAYVIPNFLDAQEAPQADAQRKRESRSRRRDIALAVSRNLLLPGAGESSGHETGQDRDVGSQPVTPILSVPSRSDPESLPPAHAILPSPVPSTTSSTRGPTLDQLWSELEVERQRVAVKLGIPLLPLVAHDEGRDLLARMLVDATGKGKRAELAAQVRNAIAVAGSEAEADPAELQWFSGAIFSARNFRRLAAAPPPRTKRKPPQPSPRVELEDRGGLVSLEEIAAAQAIIVGRASKETA